MNDDILAKRNHEGLSTEYIDRFLNKSVIIAVEERGIDNIFVHGGIVAGYACYSVLINGTNILRRFLVIDRELNLSLFININAVPKLVQNNTNTALGYLKVTDFPRIFSSSILIIPIEDRRIVHAERINNSRNLVVLQASDIVIFRTAIQSDLSKNKVAKLKFPKEYFPPFPSAPELNKEIDTCIPKPLIETEDYSLSPLPLLPLHCIIHSLILIVFSSFDIFLRIL